MKIEKEIKFYFNSSKLEEVRSKLGALEYINTKYELTVNYDNPNAELSFYNKKVDGRLRLRTMKILDGCNMGNSSCLLSWKQRIPEYSSTDIRQEHEIECSIDGKEAQDMRAILEDVLQCKLMSSYERERSYYKNKNGTVEITLDKFPFGLMLEAELKDDNAGEKEISEVIKDLEFEDERPSVLSCDGMYKKLCNEQGKKIKNHILFSDNEMPKYEINQ